MRQKLKRAVEGVGGWPAKKRSETTAPPLTELRGHAPSHNEDRNGEDDDPLFHRTSLTPIL